LRGNRPKRRRGDAGAEEIALLVEAILRDRERGRCGRNARASGDQRLRGFGRHVLELGRHHLNAAREVSKRGVIEIIADDGFGRNARSGAVGFVGENADIKAQLRGGLAQHPAQLAAAENADRAAGRERVHSGLSDTASVCAARNASTRAASVASPSARICAAIMPALAAPASPMASVPTGTPFGICTIESRLSSPFKSLLFTGTPSTGSGVIEAAMPGRWAAPPAPAMMIFSPRCLALAA